MCSTAELCECKEDKRSKIVRSNRRSKCVRCGGTKGQPSLVIRSDDPALCRNCFVDGCVHKFKSAFGKNQLVPNESKVAVAFSGGLGSCVMLNLIQNNKVRFTPVMFHLVESDDDSIKMEKIQSMMNASGFESHLMDPLQNRLLIEFCNQIRSTWTRSSLSECSEVKTWLTRLMLIRCACLLGCDFILLGTCGTRHAMNFLSGVIGGRGSVASADTTFVDRRYRDIVVLRPLFEFMSKELVYYARFQGIQWIAPMDPSTDAVLQCPGLTTLPRLCEDFLLGLQFNGFPSTTQTILSTASKLVPTSNDSLANSITEYCQLCMAPILLVADPHANPNRLALASLAHSLSISGCLQTEECTENTNTLRLCAACEPLYKNMTGELQSTLTQILHALNEDVRESVVS